MKEPNKPRPNKKAAAKGLNGTPVSIGPQTAAGERTELQSSPSPSTAGASSGTSQPESSRSKTVTLRLYIAGQTPKSLAALNNLRRLCEEHLAVKYAIELEVVDLIEKPQLALTDQILVIPTLVRKLPAPIKKIIGDLSNTERVLIGLNIQGDD